MQAQNAQLAGSKLLLEAAVAATGNQDPVPSRFLGAEPKPAPGGAGIRRRGATQGKVTGQDVRDGVSRRSPVILPGPAPEFRCAFSGDGTVEISINRQTVYLSLEEFQEFIMPVVREANRRKPFPDTFGRIRG